MAMFEVPADRVRTSVEALTGQFTAEATINAIIVSEIAVGDVHGCRERGSNTASPSAR
jgi:hypothetical protein